MRSRWFTLAATGVAVAGFVMLRPGDPLAGSDCEALSTGVLREPASALTALAIVGAGWALAASDPIAGSAVLVAGAMSFAAHATAHPLARTLDGVAAAVALLVVAVAVRLSPPATPRLGVAAAVGGAGLALWASTRTAAPLCGVLGPAGHAAWHLVVAAAVLIALAPSRRPSE